MGSKTQKPKNGFDKDPARASAAGKKSSRALPEDLKKARSHNATLIEQTIYKYLDCTFPELKRIIEDSNTPARDAVIIKILMVAISKGDQARLGFILDRTIGKVPENLNVNAARSLHEQLVESIEEDKKKNE